MNTITLPKRTGHLVTHPDGRSEVVFDAETRERQRSAMVAFHARAAAAYAANGDAKNAKAARRLAAKLAK
ncbi:MAG TPA: hypothetical protein PLN64_05845 [Candidatus Bipolaricaulis anaerobius]|nr:hypothetical protein [Candidatus Bipolaricaulis anaerobius]